MERQLWMTALPDSKHLAELSIPGTHDSAAYRNDLPGLGFAQTQQWTITQQLDNGVRFFDLRARVIDDNLVMHHGAVYLKMSLNDVLIDLERFVIAHPGEALIVLLKEEHDRENSEMEFHQIFAEKIMPGREQYYFLEPRLPTLGELRGKIFLIRRFGQYPHGFPARWQDKAHFSFSHNGDQVHVQDVYGTYTPFDFTSKRGEVEQHLSAARDGAPHELYINYLSVSGALTPYNGAYGDAFTDGMTLWFNRQYKGTQATRMGVIVADYVDLNGGELIDTVIYSNLGH
ncbi:phosphatidylinositol-specific phospholipase C domain-containing protein [Pseudomonas sp. NPDC007930]|uniref:phosphatidylinositol-specific phospholipase C n=1 Tax=Pseudomonas sp. NPDC007930 TaxID=3364417 RepID=UPI0036E82F2F